ncbi:hypothetical protein J3D55_002484 [Chryseobacterium ginsenosidimutans]|uniref:hypothetical protein n=1 Tax=Chryseobacterium ginsenosidimutans TaxID=687846 RepID=UPI002169C8CA|nr:hypothetical protein [Chryseobacterium ginsenosidimutans]MCS3869568.1 hypothetical protein [Chryseobacterium ginsenosidimutans]
MYLITIKNDLENHTFKLNEEEANSAWQEINYCLEGKIEFVTLKDEKSEVIFSTEVLKNYKLAKDKETEIIIF